MIEVGQRGLQILSGRAHPELAREIAKKLGLRLSEVSSANFANGEVSIQLKNSVRGSDVFIVQSHTGDINEAIMEQLLMIDAAKRASAKSITAVCPFLAYARQDRKATGREPIAARLIVDMLSSAGADRIISVDLHSGQIQGFFDGPFDHLIAMPLLKNYIMTNLPSENVVVVSPDAGRVKMAERYAAALKSGLAIIHKDRSLTRRNVSEARYLMGDVNGKICVMVDDMIDTAGTICTAADLLRKSGAKEIYGLATHGILSEPALKRIKASAFTKVIVTNTLPVKRDVKNKIEVVSIAPLIADAIAAVFSQLSVSALFDGQNQI